MVYLASYTIKQMANILGVHPETLRNWERRGLLIPHRVNLRGDRRYTKEHILQVQKKNLIPNPQIKALKRTEEYGTYSKDNLIDELEKLKNIKKFGLVWEDFEKEEVIERCKNETPVLANQVAKRILTDKNKPNNVLIEGDNYHALQVLNYTHRGKIDIIYIDPPYNTGAQDWKYDKYVDRNGRFRHSKWLNMMTHRLKLANNLLSEKGFIACAIGHYELFYLGVVMDEIFGEHNKLGIVTILHDPKGRDLSSSFSKKNDFMLIYAKNISVAEFSEIAMSGNEEIMIKHKYLEGEIFKNVWVDKKYQSEFNDTQLPKEIFGDKAFDYPKSLYVLVDFIKITASKNSIILDLFADSGTTGHAVLELNQGDGGNRKFILCNNNENNNDNEHGGIAESVCYSRIKKVMEGYENKVNSEQVAGLGGNLEYFKTEFLDVENIQNVPDSKKLKFTHEAGQILAFKENCFNEIKRNKHYQIFTNGTGNKYVGVYFRDDISRLDELDKRLLDKPEVKMYIFNYDDGSSWRKRYLDHENVSVEDIPEPILKFYKEVNL